MLKIPKGLKKKKKGKKGKHKGDEDLFTPEELEEYRRQKALKEQQEHQEAEAGEEAAAEEEEGAAAAAPAGAAQGHAQQGHPQPHAPAEDEDRLQALLGGVDSILNKTQRDLERIKSTSYFQRKPTASELESRKAKGPPARPAAPSAAVVAVASTSKKSKKKWVGFGDGEDEESEEEHEDNAPAPAPEAPAQPAEWPAEQPAAHEEEDEESEYEDDADDIFDTSYIDVITSGEVKLAYIPDSPVEEQVDGDDPFDTTYAAKVIGNDEDIKKRQKLEKVSLGIAVDVLTGKAVPPSKPPPLPENAVAKRAVPRRVKPVDLLKLGSFDDGSAPPPQTEEAEEQATVDGPKSILDDDALLAIPEDLPPVGTPIIPPASVLPPGTPEEAKDSAPSQDKEKEKHIDLSEFDVIADKPVVALPVSNLALVAAALGGPPPPAPGPEDDDLEDEFAALAQESLQKKKEEDDEFVVDGDDPFDTTAAAVVLGVPDAPVRAEPTADVDVLLAGPPANWSAFDDEDEHLPHLKPTRPPPPRPSPPRPAGPAPATHEEGDVDPFDTSFAQNILPGKTELKFIESEILGKPSTEHNEARILSNSDSDFDFNPREGEQAVSAVSIHVTDPAGFIDNSPVVHRDLLGGSSSDLDKLGHDPIDPAESRQPDEEASTLHDDPFDTSAVDGVAAPGKTELRYLEQEILGDVNANSPTPRDDDEFDPRADEARNKATRPDVLGVQPPKSVAFALPSPSVRPDLLGGGDEGATKFSKPLTPYYADQAPTLIAEQDVDPFDTSIASNIAPGKAELKVLESELVDSKPSIRASLSDDDFDPRGLQDQVVTPPANQDLFKVEDDEVGHRPLTPAVEEAAEIDPFDTSIASNIAPGKAELKVLESELITGDPQPSIKRTYTDPDFNPRDGPDQDAKDLLNEPADAGAGAKLLTPVLGEQKSIEDDIDPFDTSIASDIGPGKTELRILESELIGRQ